jgi:glycosyltransferase involved in cell wall biosynthesis
MDYVVVSPVKDEEKHIERTLKSMVAQAKTPKMWIIVDDHSSDRTAEIVESYAHSHPFIKLVRSNGSRPRQTGIAEVLAFNRGFEALEGMTFDLLVKLDGDLSFDADYFQRLVAEFASDPSLGIASGSYMEKAGGEWREVKMPAYHAAGASKVVRRECFQGIGGFVSERGWDTADEIQAMARGWKTTHFPALKMKHWKPEGTGMGLIRTSFMHGEIYYRTRGGFLTFALKALKRLKERPVVVGALAMCFGYIRACIKQVPHLVTEQEGMGYRKLLRRRLSEMLFGGPLKAK